MTALRKADLDLLIPIPIAAATFICETCFKGSGCTNLFSVCKNPLERYDCQSCGRPVDKRADAEKVKERETLDCLNPHTASPAAMGRRWLMADTEGELDAEAGPGESTETS